MALEQVAVAGHRLTSLRQIFGLTQGDLADRLGVSQSFLSHIARGARPMPDSLVATAGREFGLPVSFFMVNPSAAEMGPVTFRKNSHASARDEARVVALYDEASRIFRTVSEMSKYPAADLPEPADYGHDPELVAEAMRSATGLGPKDPVRNATRALEKVGVGVIDNLDYLDDDVRGHTAVSRPSTYNKRPLVALVGEVPAAVKRLTLLHEAGHLIFDRDLVGPVSGVRSPEEKRAYRFAGAYLLPERVVRDRVSETLNLHGYLPIKADFGISVGAIIMRARDLGVVSPHRARSLQIQLSSHGWRTNEPVGVAQERPVLLGQAIRRVYGSHATTKAATDLGATPLWINQWTHAGTDRSDLGSSKVIDLTERARARRSDSPG